MHNRIDTQRGYHFYKLDDSVIGFRRFDELTGMDTDPAVSEIVKHTVNTWQANRTPDEILQNTVQGKIVEQMLEDLIAHHSDQIQYLPYDSFRNDNYEKHAPFDGLLFQKDNPMLAQAQAKILQDVTASRYGAITNETLSWLAFQKIYTVEAKSSRVPDRCYPETFPRGGNDWDAQNALIANLRELDLFFYPKYTRNLGRKIHDFAEYLAYVKAEHPELSVPEKSFREILLAEEAASKCHIYTRVFVDKRNTKNMLIYILGYALKGGFF